MGGERPGERRRRQRRSPIGVAVVTLVVDRGEHLERVVDPVIELARDVVELLVVAVDEAGDFRRAHIEAIVEPLHIGAAARAEMRAVGAERVDRRIQFVLDWPGGRLFRDEIDGRLAVSMMRDVMSPGPIQIPL